MVAYLDSDYLEEIAAKIVEGVNHLFVAQFLLLDQNFWLQFQPDEWVESIIFDKSCLRFRVNTVNMICQVLNQVDALSHSAPSG